jgi:hypothetical protein
MGFAPQAADQWQKKDLGVGHIHGHIQKIFKKPEPADGTPKRIALPPEGYRHYQGNQELSERSSQNVHGKAKKTERGVAEFMENQVYPMQPSHPKGMMAQ